MARLFLLLFFSVQTAIAFAQNTPITPLSDSLEAVQQVDSLLKISRAFISARELDKAFEANAVVEKIALEKLGPKSPGYAGCCSNYGKLYYFKGDYTAAEKWYIEAGGIYEKSQGKEHSDYATNLSNLARLYFDMGYYEKAEPLLLECMAIRKKVLGKDHPNYTSIQINLASLYLDLGANKKAEQVLFDCKSAMEKATTTESANYAYILNYLASLYYRTGDYEKVEPLYLEAKAILEKVMGKEHPAYAGIMNNLAVFYKNIGAFDKAEPLYLEATAIREKKLGKENPEYATSLNNLANLYKDMRNYEKAKQLYLEALAIKEKALGKDSPSLAYGLTNLANLYTEMGQYGKAEQLQLEAIAIQEKAIGKEHQDYTMSLHRLAVLYAEMGLAGKAEPLFLEAKAIREKVLGKEHPDYLAGLENLANFYENQNLFLQSEPLLEELSALEQTRLSKSVSYLSERDLADYTTTFQKSGDKLGAYLLQHPPEDWSDKLSALLFDHALFQKGFLLTAAARLRNFSSSSSETEETNNRLKGYRRSLAAEYSKPVAQRKGVAELEGKANITEQELARLTAGYAENTRQVRWQEVQNTLKTGEAAIEFIHFQVTFPQATDSVMYAALLLKKDAQYPVFIPLFEEKTLDALLQTSGTRQSEYINRLYGVQQAGEKSLYQLLWQPLEKELAGVNKVYFSASGLLHRLKLNAIPIPPLNGAPDGAILADRFQFTQVSSTRQLVTNKALATNSGDAAALFGGIQFDMNESAISKANAGFATRSSEGTRGELDFSKTDSLLRLAPQPQFSPKRKRLFGKKEQQSRGGGDWKYLSWTEIEVDMLQPILASAGMETTTFKGYLATEEAFKSLQSPRIVHLATHGYFFPDPQTAATFNSGEPIIKISAQPMIRSGLILAGGNYAWKNGTPLQTGMEDGILTAYEIAQMDLSNTELVVLSACETGLGDIQGNEGVYGLQRAFKIAGAKYLIMSLWQVPDFQTQELMTAFYQHYLTEKISPPDAFRLAQQEMRKKYKLPYFWAGFVLVE